MKIKNITSRLRTKPLLTLVGFIGWSAVMLIAGSLDGKKG